MRFQVRIAAAAAAAAVDHLTAPLPSDPFFLWQMRQMSCVTELTIFSAYDFNVPPIFVIEAAADEHAYIKASLSKFPAVLQEFFS